MDRQTIVDFSSLAAPYADAMIQYAPDYGIVGPYQWAAFLAQTSHESCGYLHTTELWGPTLAQKTYAANRLNAYPEARQHAADAGESDVGKFYRGRGLIQITFYKNFLDYSQHAYGDDRCAKNPAMLAESPDAVRSAMWYWHSRSIDHLSLITEEEFRECTKRINGGYNGLQDRIQKWEHARRILGI